MVLMLFHLCDPAVPFWEENPSGPAQDLEIARNAPKNGGGRPAAESLFPRCAVCER
jgi:hypothetical protein